LRLGLGGNLRSRDGAALADVRGRRGAIRESFVDNDICSVVTHMFIAPLFGVQTAGSDSNRPGRAVKNRLLNQSALGAST
jgi:hypothetical protein